jgi:hypothetical protein
MFTDLLRKVWDFVSFKQADVSSSSSADNKSGPVYAQHMVTTLSRTQQLLQIREENNIPTQTFQGIIQKAIGSDDLSDWLVTATVEIPPTTIEGQKITVRYDPNDTTVTSDEQQRSLTTLIQYYGAQLEAAKQQQDPKVTKGIQLDQNMLLVENELQQAQARKNNTEERVNLEKIKSGLQIQYLEQYGNNLAGSIQDVEKALQKAKSEGNDTEKVKALEEAERNLNVQLQQNEDNLKNLRAAVSLHLIDVQYLLEGLLQNTNNGPLSKEQSDLLSKMQGHFQQPQEIAAIESIEVRGGEQAIALEAAISALRSQAALAQTEARLSSIIDLEIAREAAEKLDKQTADIQKKHEGNTDITSIAYQQEALELKAAPMAATVAANRVHIAELKEQLAQAQARDQKQLVSSLQDQIKSAQVKSDNYDKANEPQLTRISQALRDLDRLAWEIQGIRPSYAGSENGSGTQTLGELNNNK